MLYKLKFLLLLFLFSASKLSAQSADSITYSQKFFVVDSIVIVGNKVTKERIFYNELTVNIGDTLALASVGSNLNAIHDNLLNTSLFNFARVTASSHNSNHLVINITVVERWYWWVMPIFEHADRNFSSFLHTADWSRVRYGGFVENANFLGRMKRLKIRLKLGYQEVLNLSFQSPQYKHDIGWGASLDFLNQHQVQVVTIDDKPVSFTPFEELGIVRFVAKSSLNYRHNLYHHHQLTLSFTRLDANDSIALINPNYLYNGKSHVQYLELAYSYNKDTRDSRIYPLKGSFYGFDLSNMGFGLWDKGMNFLTGAIHYKRYWPLTNKFNLGSQWDGFFVNSNKIPYFMNFGLGYQDFINGYEFNVIEGSSYFTSQNRILFNLLPTRTANIKFIPWIQFSKIHYAFYLKTFFDFGYIYNKYPGPTNVLPNTLLYSAGLGIDFVTYYDKVFGLAYSINRSGQLGIYAHINLKL